MSCIVYGVCVGAYTYSQANRNVHFYIVAYSYSVPHSLLALNYAEHLLSA